MSKSLLRRLCVAATVVAAFAVPASAGATDIVVNDDSDGPGPAGANCAAPDQATITDALTAAAASGDRILVCAGTYVQPQLLITKSVDLIGAGAGQSIIDGGNATGLPSPGLIRTTDSTNGDVLVHGFTVQNAGQTGTGTPSYRAAIVPKGNDPGATHEYSDLEIIGLGSGGNDFGFYDSNTDQDVILSNSTITGTDFNPVLVETPDGAVTIRDNTISSGGSTAIFAMTPNDPTSKPIRILNNDISAAGSSGIAAQSSLGGAGGSINALDVRGNDLSEVGAFGISIVNIDPSASGLPGEISNVNVDQNTITGSSTTTGIRVQGRVRNVGVQSNTLAGLGTGLLFSAATAGHAPVGVHVAFNRIAGNAVAGLTSNAAEPIDAEHNWWGCNEGPGQPGCDAINGTGTVDADPWLVLGLAANPTAIETNGDTSRLTADVLSDSDGNLAGAGLPEGTPVTFATTLGSVTSPVGTADGIATSTLTSGAAEGTADVTATLDGETVGTQVSITNPPPTASDTTINSGPANGATTNDTTPTFGFASDDVAATFECRYDGGAWRACSGPGNSDTPSADLSEGIHTFEVRSIDASSNPDPSPAGRTFLVDVPDPPAPPETTIDSGPANGGTTNDTTPTFSFTSDATNATFQCRYDGGGWRICRGSGNSDTPASDLSEGIHTFEVRAFDNTSTPDPTPAGRTFLVDVLGPRENPRASLRLTVDPRQVRLQPHKSARYAASVENTGDATAGQVKICARVPKQLELKGKRCQTISTLAPDATATRRFKVKARRGSPARLYTIRFKATAAGVSASSAAAKLRVPRRHR